MMTMTRRVHHRHRHRPPHSHCHSHLSLIALLLLVLFLGDQEGVGVVAQVQSPAWQQLLCQEQPYLPGCQSCRDFSFLPGCNDPTCTKRVCSALNQTQCCTRSWGLECVALAQFLCFPEIMPWYEKLNQRNDELRRMDFFKIRMALSFSFLTLLWRCDFALLLLLLLLVFSFV
jgi:hypothetical protein